MARERFILKDKWLAENAPGKSWGVPMIGDILEVVDDSGTTSYNKVCTIEHINEGTKYSTEPISKHAVRIRRGLNYQIFFVKVIGQQGYPLIEFNNPNYQGR